MKIAPTAGLELAGDTSAEIGGGTSLWPMQASVTIKVPRFRSLTVLTVVEDL